MLSTCSPNKLTVGGLFSGIGGFELGFVRAGFEVIWMVEIDEFCQKVLRKNAPDHWSNAKIYGDIKNVGKENLTPPDVIVGGFPCQPHSLAGKRKGAADDRDLWPEYRRIITELNPAYIVGENVPGIRTTILDQVLSDLENLKYATATFVIPACAVDAPHRRDRVFIVAYAKGNGREQGNQNGGGSVEGIGTRQKQRFGDGGGAMAHATGAGLEGANSAGATRAGGWPMQRAEYNGWKSEPGVGRVANGIPNRVDRLRSLGNAVVPQVAEFIASLVVRHHITNR